MQAETAIARLESYGAQILHILEDARPLLRIADASRMKALALARWQLLRVLREYQIFKHTQIFDPIIARGPATKMSFAQGLKDRCLVLGDAFAAHVQRWSLEGPTKAWSTYCEEALALSDQIERHLAEEAREVAALLSGMERTRRAG